MYPWFGVPQKVISDRDPRFTSHFGKGLAKLLGIQQNLSTAFHPQTDGISEWKNQWIEQYLRLVTSYNPDDWTWWLPVATAVHNHSKNSTIKATPMEVLMEMEASLHPRTQIKQLKNGLKLYNISARSRLMRSTERHHKGSQRHASKLGIKHGSRGRTCLCVIRRQSSPQNVMDPSRSSKKYPLWRINYNCRYHGTFTMSSTHHCSPHTRKHPLMAPISPDHPLILSMGRKNMRWKMS